MKFIRRKELDVEIRLNIVILALSCQGIYGARMALAHQYNISRSFLYQLLGAALLSLHEMFNTESVAISPVQLDLDSAIVLLRLEGKVSIGSISEILRMQDYPHDSTGMVSERLKHFGENLPNTLSTEQAHDTFCLSDEVFANDNPILITIEPASTAILRIELAPNRKADTWQGHFEALHEQQFIIKGLGRDRGNGLVQGYQTAYHNFVWCSDHFHELRGLNQLRASLEKQAYAAIGDEQERLRVFNNACSEDNLEKRLQQRDKATTACEQKMAQYQQFPPKVKIE